MQDATSDEIRELFSQFGTVKAGNGAITLKHNGSNNSFAYVDFMDVASAQACVDAKDVMLKDSIVCTVQRAFNTINCMPCCYILASRPCYTVPPVLTAILGITPVQCSWIWHILQLCLA